MKQRTAHILFSISSFILGYLIQAYIHGRLTLTEDERIFHICIWIFSLLIGNILIAMFHYLDKL